MLKIKLSPPHIVNKKYVVFIDNIVKQSFSNKRSALDYITRVEKELNEAFLFINEEYSLLSGYYRTYFLADRDYKFKYEVENNFDLINNRLIYISSHTESENFNSIISQAINICFDALTEACDLIDAKSHARYDMLTSRRISLHKKVIKQYREGFESFKAESVYSNHLKSKTA
jgi:hypothetical protein